MRRAAGLPPLERLVAVRAAQAIALFANKLEGMVRYEEVPLAARINAELLLALQKLRADVSALLSAGGGGAGEPGGASSRAQGEDEEDAGTKALRAALAKLAPGVTALANPSVPLPEALRGDATTMLKQLLRREMMEDS